MSLHLSFYDWLREFKDTPMFFTNNDIQTALESPESREYHLLFIKEYDLYVKDVISKRTSKG
jgi:hypothetical protein